MIKPEKYLPKYYQLKEYLKQMIQNGDIIPAQKLPSESDLVRQFKISRHTVRHSFSELENEGWIYREQGKGTFALTEEVKKSRK